MVKNQGSRVLLIREKTSPNMRMSVTDIRIAAHGGTSLSNKIGRDCGRKKEQEWSVSEL